MASDGEILHLKSGQYYGRLLRARGHTIKILAGLFGSGDKARLSQSRRQRDRAAPDLRCLRAPQERGEGQAGRGLAASTG